MKCEHTSSFVVVSLNEAIRTYFLADSRRRFTEVEMDEFKATGEFNCAMPCPELPISTAHAVRGAQAR